MSNALDGWALLYKTVERDIQTKSDVLITVVHWQLLRVGMKCIGIGDDKTLSESDEESELLPDGWNIDKNSYALRYKYQNEVFVLLGMVVDDSMVLNLLNGKSLDVTNASFVLEPTVAALKGQLSNLIPDIQPVIDRLKKELFDPVLFTTKKSSETQTPNPQSPNYLPPNNQPNYYIPPEVNFGERQPDYLRDLRGIGRNDLDPLGGRFGSGGGGGMLFNPPGLRNPRNIGPNGSIPGAMPGARFDPFNPPEVERQRRNDRDFDHFRPPGGPGSNFHDDMFM